jgi:16S rRNA processing protein RimM
VVGAELVDQHGRSHGRVRAVLDNPASDLLELEDGRLVPSVFIVDHQPGVRVTVEVPSGLLDDASGPDDGSGA